MGWNEEVRAGSNGDAWIDPDKALRVFGLADTADIDFMVDHRIAPRHAIEARISIRFQRGNRTMSVSGWMRDLSESGLGAFVAARLAVGEDVTLLLSFSASGKHEIPARVARQLGTQYGFQFLALSRKQRDMIRTVLIGQPVIPYARPQVSAR